MSPRRSRSSPVVLFSALAAGLAAVLIALARSHLAASYAVAYILSINLVTFGFYGYDKAISGRRALRVPEATLHILALAGGTPLAWVAQRTFRHKTLKRSFRRTFRILAAVQAAALVWAVWYFRGA